MEHNGVCEVKPQNRAKTIHVVLAYSYTTYFLAFLIGIIADIIYPWHFLYGRIQIIGVVLIFFATFIIFWAQETSRKFGKKASKGQIVCSDDFRRGPYRFTRGPTHTGLALLLLGFGFIFSSVWIVITTAIAFCLAQTIFLREMEDFLEKRYGELYKQYKKIVSKII